MSIEREAYEQVAGAAATFGGGMLGAPTVRVAVTIEADVPLDFLGLMFEAIRTAVPTSGHLTFEVGGE